MTVVNCKHCEASVDAESCWCVIDTATKQRYFECKNQCVQLPVTGPPFELALAMDPEVLSNDNEEKHEADDRILHAEPIQEYDPGYPSQGLLQRVLQWFSATSGYQKVKVS